MNPNSSFNNVGLPPRISEVDFTVHDFKLRTEIAILYIPCFIFEPNIRKYETHIKNLRHRIEPHDCRSKIKI